MKKLLLLTVLGAGYLNLVVNTQSPLLKNVLYQDILGAYGRVVSARVEMKVLYDPGSKNEAWTGCRGILAQDGVHILGWKQLVCKSNRPGDGLKVAVITPEARAGNSALVSGALEHHARIMVECSRMDKWHTSAEGQASLSRMHGKCLRVVVFDGGHHLPTLGTCPDVILVPRTGGYAAHSYMSDGMRVEKLRQLLAATGSPSALVSVPRWGLVKSDSSLGLAGARAVKLVLEHERKRNDGTIKAAIRPSVSKLNGAAFCYIGRESPQEMVQRLKQIGLSDVTQIYVAFDYARTDITRSGIFADRLQKATGKPVEIVNQPVRVIDALLWGG